ncbi:MAG TPA: DUF167 domain-containing protein [Thermoplasmata archaeon]|jgi:hypothetical protein|nr:DUF167 domain-containing protein [Thermoplasmata archaeon]
MGRIEIWARPGSRVDGVTWDDWRKRWVVSCCEPPAEGRANHAVVRLLAERLDVPRTSIRLVVGGRTRAKVIEVDGLSEREISTRLQRVP